MYSYITVRTFSLKCLVLHYHRLGDLSTRNIDRFLRDMCAQRQREKLYLVLSCFSKRLPKFFQISSAKMLENSRALLFAIVLLGSLDVHHAALPAQWCCMLNPDDAKTYPACQKVDCNDVTDTTPTTTTPATTTPNYIMPAILDPDAVSDTGNTTRVEGSLLSSRDQFEGDILGLAPDAVMELENNTGRNFLKDEERHWRDRTIPYVLSKHYRPKDKQSIRDALEDFMLKTPLKFREKKETDKDFVYFAPGYGCNSYIGKLGGQQTLSLQVPGCMKRGLILHELMHATGFYHEQARTDRDDYVEINWSNIPKDLHGQFQSYSEKNITAFGKPYDFESILHYGRYDFAVDSDEWTIRPRKNKTEYPGADKMGQRFAMSEIDLEKLKLAYPDESDSSCPKGKGWKKILSICYYFSFLTDTEQRDFASARTFCREKGAIISPEPTNATVAEFFKSQMYTSLESDARIYVASCNTISPGNVEEPQETNCTPLYHFICSKRLNVKLV